MERASASKFRPLYPQRRPLFRVSQQSCHREYALHGTLTFIAKYGDHGLNRPQLSG
jgi:hypothetical protein